MRAVIHPHAGGYIEFADEIERIAADVPKEVAGFSKHKLARAFLRWLGTHELTDLTDTEQTGVVKLLADVNKALGVRDCGPRKRGPVR